MSKEKILFGLGVIGYIGAVFFVISLARVSPAQEPAKYVPAPPTKLLCFNSKTEELRESDSNLGCAAEEASLGDAPIEHGDVRPNGLNPTFAVRFQAAQAAAKKLGHNLRITSGFRSQELQARLFEDAVKKYGSEEEASKWVLPRDISHHPWGTAIDVNYPGDKVAVKWLEENGSRFGICRVYENEWWHFEPVIAPGGTCPKMVANALSSLESSPTGAEELN